MNDQFKTPLNKVRPDGPSLRSAVKRDSLAAELERDPQMSAAKRQQRTQVFTSSISHASLERQLLAAQTAKLELETKLREKELLVERLERDRRWFADREKEEREEKERERVAHEEEKRKSDSDNRSLRTSLSTLREEHADLQDVHQALSRSSNQSIASQKAQITTLTHQSSLFQEVNQLNEIAQKREQALNNLQVEYDELSSRKEDTARRASDEESMSVVREELHRQANYLRNLEATNSKLTSELKFLRERHTSVEVLREEKRGLERKVLMLEELRTKVVKLEAEVEAGRKEREHWANMSDSKPSNTPVSVTQTLTSLRLEHARLLEEHGASVALLRQREAELVDFERRDAQAREMISTLEQNFNVANEKIGRRETRTLIAEREVNFLQALVASFNAEEEHGEDSVFDTAKSERIRQLETLLEEYKSTNEQLQKELDALGGESSKLESRQILSEEIEKERLEKSVLQKELESTEAGMKENLDKIEELEQTLFELRGEIAGGRHVPPGLRILSMVDNPEQQWFDLRQAAMDRLKGENEALMKRLKELEESGARVTQDHGEELVPRASWELINREKIELEDVVRQKEKRLLRLQQIFTSKSAEFREAVASILGVKLYFSPNGQVRVTSLYDLRAAFVFQPTSKSEGAKMQLVEQGEGGPQDLPNLMRYWIAKEQCIPGFLASVTLECYDKSKREQDGLE